MEPVNRSGALPLRPETRDPELDRILHPARFYRQPADVLADISLSAAERRAILSSWASDASAVLSRPAWRHPPFATQPVTFDDVMEALAQLDLAGPDSGSAPARRAEKRGPPA